MKIILGSENFTSDLATAAENLLSAKLIGKYAVIIPNAATGIEKDETAAAKVQELEQFGIKPFVLDLALNSLVDIKQHLAKSDIIIMTGGLVSNLMNIVDDFALRKFLLKLFQDKLVLTFSAGSMAMSKTQYLAENFIGEPDPEVKKVKGFGIIDFELYPQYHEELKPEILQILPPSIHAYGLNDNDAIVINDNSIEYIGNIIQIN